MRMILMNLRKYPFLDWEINLTVSLLPEKSTQDIIFTYDFEDNVSLVLEHLPLEDISHVTLPPGERRMKRIAFTTEVRNRTLGPIHNSSLQFDKFLSINDIKFNPIATVQLVFPTNINTYGRAEYGAACAVGFIDAFKFYDRFATRDFEGHEMGVPFFPWSTDAGDLVSRQDVLAQKDAVRVRVCWGGMTAFEASWFQSNNADVGKTFSRGTPESNVADIQLSPLLFRYELDPF
ncbi:hypothetical protein G7Y89_g13624 [Cudoniella acicularis]|uniref:Uncharacterized protein n=1 Tax=Cudoniella acicularis TaxID=354080 RepID=A0A8H4R9G5_9HELO|nr:hypothetical protein G7Y89_g13624 [Cudoniella acicularis]